MSDDERADQGRTEQQRGGNDQQEDEDRGNDRGGARDGAATNRYQEERARRREAAAGGPRPSDEKADSMRSKRANEPQRVPPKAALREDLVQNAVKFLTHPSVRNSSSDKQVTFLRDHKNMTRDEIIEAYNRANMPIPAFPPVTTPASSSSNVQRADYYRPKEGARYDGDAPSRPPLAPPPGPYGYPPQGGAYPMYPPYSPYTYPPPPPPPQAPVAPPPPPGYALRAIVLTGVASATLALGAAYVAKNYIVPRLYPASLSTDLKSRELPEPPQVDDLIRQRSSKMKEEILQDIQKATNEQQTSTAEAVSSLKTLLQQALEKKDNDIADLKAEVSTLKTRMRDMQSYKSSSISSPSASVGVSSPSSALPPWQREPQRPIGANRWSITSDTSPTLASPHASASYPPPPPSASQMPQPSAVVANGGTTPVSTSPTQPSSPTRSAREGVAPPASVRPAAATTPQKNPGEKPYSFQNVMDMVARGEVPPDVRQDIDDKPLQPAGSFDAKGTRDPPPKPWATAAGGSPSNDWSAVRDPPPPAAVQAAIPEQKTEQ